MTTLGDVFLFINTKILLIYSGNKVRQKSKKKKNLIKYFSWFLKWTRQTKTKKQC